MTNSKNKSIKLLMGCIQEPHYGYEWIQNDIPTRKNNHQFIPKRIHHINEQEN